MTYLRKVMEAEFEETQTALKQELSSLSFEELLKLKEKLGDKIIKSALCGSTKTKDVTFKRKDKNRPREMSSKRPVSSLRPVMNVKKKISRDPRFDDLSGSYKEHSFKTSYAFLNDIKAKEKKELEKSLRKEQDFDRKEKMQSLLQRIKAQEKQEEKKLNDEKRKREWRKKQIDNIKDGKKPYFLKQSDKKLLDLADKYESLKKSGKLEKYLIRKRKKNLAQDRKMLTASDI